MDVVHVSAFSLSVSPKVQLTPAGPLRVRMGDAVSVECRATGRPRPTVDWKRQGSTLQLLTREVDDANVLQVNHGSSGKRKTYFSSRQ